MHSAVAHGRLWHRRMTPKPHDFSYRISLIHLDLGEVDAVFGGRWLWSWNRPNLACVLRRDHLHGGDADLAEEVRNRIEAVCGERPTGPISLLTQPRYWGYNMNPISFYFVWSADRSRIDWLLLEVHNTPWGEQHPYILKGPEDQRAGVEARFDKAMHVSPFFDMDMHYRLRLRFDADQHLAVTLENWREDERLFSAHMALDFAPISAASLAGLLVKTPFMSMKVVAAIYYEALRIKLKGVPYVPHPGTKSHADPLSNPSGVTPK